MHNFYLFIFALSAFNANAASWDHSNNPAILNANYHYQFDELPLSGTVGDEAMPWSDNYWESDWGGISLRWNTLTVKQRDPDLFEYRNVHKERLFEYIPPSLEELHMMSRDQLLNLSPAEKYDILMSRYDYPTVKAERHLTSPDMKDWQGLCHGWVAAAINEPEPSPVDVPNADGIVVPFGSSDLKGLLSYYYGITAYRYARGNRQVARNGSLFQMLDKVDSFDLGEWISLATHAVVFNSRGYQINPSSLAEGRAVNATVDEMNLVAQVGSRSDHDDPNAGAFFVIMTNQLGRMHKAFIENINRFGKPNEIWNQPVVNYQNRIDFVQGSKIGITTTLGFVSEIPQNYHAVLGTSEQRIHTMTFSYEIEVNSSGRVVGGTWGRGRHPGFIWSHGKIPVKGYFGRLSEVNRH